MFLGQKNVLISILTIWQNLPYSPRSCRIYVFLQLKRKKKEKTKFLDVPDLARYVILPDLALSGKVQDLEESGLEMQNGLENDLVKSGKIWQDLAKSGRF